MAIDFPASPALNQSFTAAGLVYIWNGYAWTGGGPAAAVLAHGQCRYVWEGANACRLVPYNGNALIISGKSEIVPAAGIPITGAGTFANTNYYIYAYMNAGVMALEKATTGYARHTNGVIIKSGDPSRTLVGMSRSFDGTTWLSEQTYGIYNISWFNRRKLSVQGQIATGSTAATTPTEVNSSTRIHLMNWGGEAVSLINNGAIILSALGTPSLSIWMDNTAQLGAGPSVTIPTGTYYHNAAVAQEFVPAEGYHFYNVKTTSPAGTSTVTLNYGLCGSTWG